MEKNPSNIQDGADLAKELHMWKKDLEDLVDSKPMSKQCVVTRKANKISVFINKSIVYRGKKV